jgi:hypothetical protein
VAYAHTATLRAVADDAAPGAAVTVALCGRVEHEPPCPLAAHHTAADRAGDELHLRILFAADPADEPEVRRRTALPCPPGRSPRRPRPPSPTPNGPTPTG